MIDNFNDFCNTLNEQLINKHSTHIEELIFTNQKQGLQQAIEGLRFIADSIGTCPPVSTKIDGCVHEDTLVLTTKGPKKISTLTEDDFVASFNTNTNQAIFTNNTHPRITGKNKSWVQVSLSNGGIVTCTSDHKWLTASKRYVEASKLKGKLIYSTNANNNTVYVSDVTPIKQKYDQWDLSTVNENFIIVVNDVFVVIHNSPAVFIVNGDKGFGVASKSIFNKNPKINYTPEDVDNNHKGDLAVKLKACLQYLKGVVPNTKNTVYQGDVLFTKGDVKRYKYHDTHLVGFQPNTLLYTVDVNSDSAKKILASDVGVAFHTMYKWNGVDPSTLSVAKFGVSTQDWKTSPHAFIIDTVSNNKANAKVTLSDQQTKQIKQSLSQAEKIGSSFDWNFVNSELAEYLQRYINSYIRENVAMVDPEKRTEKFFEWLENLITKEKDSKKTTKGKANVDARFENLRGSKKDETNITKLFEIFDCLTAVKLILIEKLNAISNYGKFVITSKGDLVPTGDEGFVVTQGPAKGVKLVDRYTFSKNNFAKDIIHGWQHND